MTHTILTIGRGFDIAIRGRVHQERFPRGTFSVAIDIEVERLDGRWVRLTNEHLLEVAATALVEVAR